MVRTMKGTMCSDCGSMKIYAEIHDLMLCEACYIRRANEHLCGYSHCFRKARKKRGFLWVCDFHLKHPKKWGNDGMTFTGTTFVKDVCER